MEQDTRTVIFELEIGPERNFDQNDEVNGLEDARECVPKDKTVGTIIKHSLDKLDFVKKMKY